MFELLSPYTDLDSQLEACGIVHLLLEDMSDNPRSQAHLIGFDFYESDWRGYWSIGFRKNYPLKHHVKSLGHEIGHLLQDAILHGVKKEKWPDLPGLLGEIRWKEDEENIANLFAEGWSRKINFYPDVIRLLKHLKKTDQFILLL
jgi:hypothetical protein